MGINTWQSILGQNLNFSPSASHLQELIQKSGTIVQSLSMLPKPRGRALGDVDKTLAEWKQLNRLKNALAAKLTPLDNRLTAIPPADPKKPTKGRTARLAKKAAVYHSMGQAYADFAAKVKALKTTDIDLHFLILTIAEADVAQRAGDLCDKISAAATAQSENEVLMGERTFKRTSSAWPRTCAPARSAPRGPVADIPQGLPHPRTDRQSIRAGRRGRNRQGGAGGRGGRRPRRIANLDR